MPPIPNSKKLNNVTYRRPAKWQLLLLGILAMLIILCLWAVTHTVQIRDWYILSTYHPPAVVKQLANEDTMTSYAKMLFYVNEPNLANKTVFASNCPNGTDETYVIGCYHSGDHGIYLLNVTDPRLNGIVPVTAAYEMLHAGYARLSDSERATIDKEMWSFYLAHVTSSEIKQQMASYAVTEPGAKYDELYSVLATEVAKLPPALSNHYKLYFTDRSKIVAMYQSYQAAFNIRQTLIQKDTSQLSALKKTITANEATLNSMEATINSRQVTLNQLSASGNISAYNAAVGQYNLYVDRYNSLLETTRGQITYYNQLVANLNSQVLIEQQLTSDLNTSKLPSAVK